MLPVVAFVDSKPLLAMTGEGVNRWDSLFAFVVIILLLAKTGYVT